MQSTPIHFLRPAARTAPWAILGLAFLATEAHAGGPFLRGDANGDGAIDISDGIATLQFLYNCDDCPLVCDDAADFDDNGAIEITDAIATFSFLFQGGGEPAAPYEAPGEDVTDDGLTCGPEGRSQWDERFGGVGDQRVLAGTPTGDGGYIVAGASGVFARSPSPMRRLYRNIAFSPGACQFLTLCFVLSLGVA